MSEQVLVAGVGNIFLGDDGFGVEVAQRLSASDIPEGVDVGDYGISGMHLAYDILRGYPVTILVDALPRGEQPGTVTVLEIDPEQQDASPGGAELLDAHGMQPDAVIGMVRMLGGSFGKLLVVGCEPESVADGMGLTERVDAAVPGAVDAVLELATAELAAARSAAGVDAAGRG